MECFVAIGDCEKQMGSMMAIARLIRPRAG
jgi:hypothetical protein